MDEILAEPKAELVTDSPHYEIDQIVNRLRPVIEAGHGGQDHAPGVGQLFHVLERNAA